MILFNINIVCHYNRLKNRLSLQQFQVKKQLIADKITNYTLNHII